MITWGAYYTIEIINDVIKRFAEAAGESVDHELAPSSTKLQNHIKLLRLKKLKEMAF